MVWLILTIPAHVFLACVILKQLATSILTIFLLLHIAGYVVRVMVGDAWEQKIVEDN